MFDGNMQEAVADAYKDEIRSLQEEIRALTQQHKENQTALLSDTNIKKALQSYRGKAISDVRGAEAVANLKSQLGDCEKELEFLAKISGIEFTQYCKKTEYPSANQTLYKHRLMGQCQSLTFQLEFHTTESQINKGGLCSDVTDLNIIMECGEYSQLSKFVSRTEERENLLLFFRTLSSFAEWCEYRKRTFLQFKQKYPAAVELPVGSSAEYMVLQSPQLPGCKLLVVWKIQVDEEGTVTPVLDLLPKIPEQALALGKMQVLENDAQGFRNLLQVFGIEDSIEKLIQFFCLTEIAASD
ncbi:centromere protein P isoform X3 [Ascaphus truei]|uniref:centromere protein P isoform X3 n=1 Tax=Ascaphus truei TaxID=8439 RepID=UPI003F5A7C3A